MYQRMRVVLNISSYQLSEYYEGAVDSVVARATDGRTVKFPANILRSVVQDDGVYGTFELTFDKRHKFVSIRRISG
ncbi:MAG: DUF2835 domain-containing protein [Candidatus Brocadiales bacterium]|nr:DUF2835 domain-containing protein [Candidatus Brocadiales bacterium]